MIYLEDNPSLPIELGPFYSHEYLNYYSITALNSIVNLPKIQVMPNPNFGDWEVGPNHKDSYREIIETFTKQRDLDVKTSFNSMEKNSDFSYTPSDTTVEPWKVFTLYSIEPDLELDVDLYVHWTQKLTGGSHTLRHMKFKLLGFPFGQADKVLLYYMNAAKRAASIGNMYWAWRFLGRAAHYAADLGHPFHVSIAPNRDVLKLIKDPKKFMVFTSATHTSHEVYVTRRFREKSQLFISSIQSGAQTGFQEKKARSLSYIKKWIKMYRANASRGMSTLHKIIMDNFGPGLIEIYQKIHNEAYKNMDLSKKTNFAKSEACDYIYTHGTQQVMAELDKITSYYLNQVGISLGMLIKWFITNSGIQIK